MFTDDEEKLIEIEMRKKKKTDSSTAKKLFLYLLLATVCYVPSISSHYICQADAWRWFPDTWRCKYCGYENYDGIRTCAVCGTPK